MCLTETWHKPDVFSVLNETCPLPPESPQHRPRRWFVCHLPWWTGSVPPASTWTVSFECLAFKCKPPFLMSVLLIWRPPKPNIPEMYNLLSSFCSTSANTIILGDMKIHLKNPSLSPTHPRGHTLDLVITDSAPISNLLVYDLGMSDHKVTSVELAFRSPNIKNKHQLRWKTWTWKTSTQIIWLWTSSVFLLLSFHAVAAVLLPLVYGTASLITRGHHTLLNVLKADLKLSFLADLMTSKLLLTLRCFWVFSFIVAFPVALWDLFKC